MSVFRKFQQQRYMQYLDSQQPCKGAHRVNGVVPQKKQLEYDGKVCDCGKLIFYKERCNCPSHVTPSYDLKSKPNNA